METPPSNASRHDQPGNQILMWSFWLQPKAKSRLWYWWGFSFSCGLITILSVICLSKYQMKQYYHFSKLSRLPTWVNVVRPVGDICGLMVANCLLMSQPLLQSIGSQDLITEQHQHYPNTTFLRIIYPFIHYQELGSAAQLPKWTFNVYFFIQTIKRL